MEKEKAGKAAALVVASVSLTLCAFRWDWCDVGVYAGCGVRGRLLHPFFHAGFVHALLNMWCLVSVVFVCNVGAGMLLAAYVASALFPGCLMGDMPTAGFSGAVFFLFGSVLFRVRRRLRWLAWMAFYLLAGFLMPGTNGFIHLWCFAAGLLCSFLDKPFKHGGD